MANLLETIQQNRAALASQQQGVGDETQAIQSLLRAKSGKAPTTSDTGISNLGEQSAAATANQTQGQLAGAAAVQTQAENTQAAGIQQDTSNQLQNVSQARRFDTLQNRLQTQSVLNSLGQQKGDLSDQKSQAALEQIAFTLSMQDKKYVDTLQSIGARRRLDNDLNFKTEMQQVAFGDSINLLTDRLGQGDILAASDRDFQKVLSSMSIDDAMKIAAIQAAGAQSAADVNTSLAATKAKTEATQANDAAMYGAAGNLATAGVTAYGKYSDGGLDSNFKQAQANGYKGTFTDWSALQDKESAAGGPVK